MERKVTQDIWITLSVEDLQKLNEGKVIYQELKESKARTFVTVSPPKKDQNEQGT